MCVDRHVFILPIQTMSNKDFSLFLKDQYDFLDTGFVLRNALQLWIDYLQDPDGEWHTNVEEEVHHDYGSYLAKEAGKIAFREGKNSATSRRNIDFKFKIVDSIATDIAKHISKVSTYLSNRMDERDVEKIALYSLFEVVVKSAWVSGRSIKFIIEEI